MKLIIDISEKDYEYIKELGFSGYTDQTNRVVDAISNGIVIPKRHGDLIDRNKLLNTLEKLEWIRINCSVDEDNTNILEDIINEEPTIIEANY